MTTIRKATAAEVATVVELYDAVCDHLGDFSGQRNYVSWRKGQYPTTLQAQTAFDEDALFVMYQDDVLVGTAVLNNKPSTPYPEYAPNLDYSEILMVHILAVHPDYLRKGIASQLMEFAEKLAKEMGMRAVGLDTYEKNLPGIKLYEKLGYKNIGTVDLGFSQYGMDWFLQYEKEVS